MCAVNRTESAPLIKNGEEVEEERLPEDIEVLQEYVRGLEEAMDVDDMSRGFGLWEEEEGCLKE